MTKNEIRLACNSISSSTIEITPLIATEMLKKNSMNRKINRNTINDYATEMSNGNWCCNGESIVISNKGMLLDGQHRLMAVIQSGINIASVVAVGVKKESFDTMNQGKKRGNGTILEIDGVKKNAKILAATVRAVHIYKNFGTLRVSTGGSFTPRQMKVAMSGMKNVVSHVVYGCSFKRPLFSPTIVSSLFHIFSSVNKIEARIFMNAILTGEHGGDMELLKLRNHFLDLKMRGVTLNRKRELVCGVLIKSWNAWRKGEVLKDFEYKKGDTFPTAI